jgi:hypothetical protein
VNELTMQAHAEEAHHLVHYVILGISVLVGLVALVMYVRARRRSP